MMALAGISVDTKMQLQAMIYDELQMSNYLAIKRASKKHVNLPVLLSEKLMQPRKKDSDDFMKFDTVEEFKAARERILQSGGGEK